MNQDPQPTGELSDELRALGENLRSVFQAAWDSDDRRRLQREIETGIGALAESLGQAARDFSESETGQQMKQEAREFSERVRSGEVESKVRQDLTAILRKMNEELGRAASSWSSRPPSGPEGQA
ncbi:MAG TPA: hypothetical protein VI701_00420 [Anaerolineales bacterium]|nr:hypothetical protein [Anaerolineales bacterium]